MSADMNADMNELCGELCGKLCGELFDKHCRPDLADYADPELAWAACADYEDHVYNVADSLFTDVWDRLISDVRVLYDEYYAKFES